jgi:hypothetical protein
MWETYADYLREAKPAVGPAPSDTRHRRYNRDPMRLVRNAGSGGGLGALFFFVNALASELEGADHDKALELMDQLNRVANPVEAGDDTGAAAEAGLLMGELFGVNPNLAAAALVRKQNPPPTTTSPRRNFLYNLVYGEK